MKIIQKDFKNTCNHYFHNAKGLIPNYFGFFLIHAYTFFGELFNIKFNKIVYKTL